MHMLGVSENSSFFRDARERAHLEKYQKNMKKKYDFFINCFVKLKKNCILFFGEVAFFAHRNCLLKGM